MSQPSTCHYNGPDVKVGGQLRFDHKYCDSLVRGIQNFHMDGRGWNDIAYNFVVCQHGVVYEGRGLNTWNGANGTNSGNKSSHAVMCLAGENNPFDMVEKAAFRWAVQYISERTAAPYRAIGHRDHKATACPGNTRYDWVHGGMKLSGGSTPPPSTPKEGFLMALDDKKQDDLYREAMETSLRVEQLQKIILGDSKLGNTVERTLASLTRIEKVLRGDLVSSIVAGVIAGLKDIDVDVELAPEAIQEAVEAGVREVLNEGVDPD